MNIEIVDYSNKSFAVFGDTREIKDQLKELGGKFNPRLSFKDEKCAGWIFPLKKKQEVSNLIENYFLNYDYNKLENTEQVILNRDFHHQVILEDEITDLPTGIKTLINSKGLDYLNDLKIVNALSDLHAFNQHPALRNIYKILISEGIITKILSKNNWDDFCEKLVSKTELEYAFPYNLIKYILQSILYVNSSNTKKPIFEETSCFSSTKNANEDDKGNSLKITSELTFKGIKVGGDLIIFINKLKKLDFVEEQRIEMDDGTGYICMKGRYAGYTECDVDVKYSLLNKEVLGIDVDTPMTNEWAVLYEQYFRIKNALIRKYGKSNNDNFEFKLPYASNSSDEKKMEALKNFKLNAWCIFESPKWEIYLTMMSSYIHINYEAKNNLEKLLEVFVDNDI